MDFFQPQFPTPSLRRAEARLRDLLRRELEGLRNGGGLVPASAVKGRTGAILTFAGQFHSRYDQWLCEALRQSEPVQCKLGCSNCCQHYPMSVEPFEAFRLYAGLRGREDFGRIIEDCFRRVQAFQALRTELEPLAPSGEEAEDSILQAYFSKGLRCPLLGKDGACTEHSLRPVTCRMYFSFTSPDFCTPAHLLTPANRSFHVCLPDVVEEDIGELATHYAAYGLGESLYEGILALNALEGEGLFE